MEVGHYECRVTVPKHLWVWHRRLPTGDGFFETVDALTFDLDWQLLVTAQASALGSQPKKWTVWTGSRNHIDFWDLIGSNAIEPMLVGPASVPVNTSQRYDVKMRPCWPYGESVAYSLAWEDGTSTSLNGAPQSFVSTYRTWPTQGTKPIQVTALSDGHGRWLGHTTSRSIQVGAATGTWTAWLNRDHPSGSGDWETVSDFRAGGYNICNGATPLGIECRTLSGVDWRSTGEVYTCDRTAGGICQNSHQTDGFCEDYQVRFLCP